MQREITNRNTLADTLNPINDARRSTAIDRTTSNYNDVKEKVQKIRDLINMGKYDADLAKYIHGLLDLEIQGMLDDIETREKVASYKDKEQLDFQILLTDNYYINPSNIHICFPIKIKKKTKTDNTADIDNDLITVNNLPTFSPWEVYQYSDQMLKYMPTDYLKTIQKTHLYSKKPVYFANESYERRNHNFSGVSTTGLSSKEIAEGRKIMQKT